MTSKQEKIANLTDKAQRDLKAATEIVQYVKRYIYTL